MSGKNRAFALAIATAALVGFCAPMASAATVQGGPNTGFNNDSVLNVSNNQVPIQACNNNIPINVGGLQVPINNIAAAIGLGTDSTGNALNDPSCSQVPNQENTSITDTTPATSDSGSSTTWNPCKCGDGSGSWSHTSSDPSTGNSGFNNDSVLNLSNNQVPIQACNNTIPVNVLGIQVPVTGVAGALSALGGTSNAANSPSCSQVPNQENGSSTTTG